jgi:hypothetical protein
MSRSVMQSSQASSSSGVVPSSGPSGTVSVTNTSQTTFNNNLGPQPVNNGFFPAVPVNQNFSANTSTVTVANTNGTLSGTQSNVSTQGSPLILPILLPTINTNQGSNFQNTVSDTTTFQQGTVNPGGSTFQSTTFQNSSTQGFSNQGQNGFLNPTFTPNSFNETILTPFPSGTASVPGPVGPVTVLPGVTTSTISSTNTTGPNGTSTSVSIN